MKPTRCWPAGKALARLIVVLGMRAVCASVALPVEQWGVFELTLRGPQSGRLFREGWLSAQFSQGKQQVTVSGFYAGEGYYKIRFMPPAPGK